MKHEENSEDLDDPIRLFDCSNLLDAGIIETASSERAVQRNLKYKLSLKSCYMLPVSFFDIPRNIALLNECHPIRVTIVDYYKHPWYFKNKMRLSSETNTTDSAIHSASDDDDSDIICLDLIRDTDKIPSKLLDTTNYTDVIDLTSRDRSTKKRRAKFLDKRRKTFNGKLDLELRKALSQKHSTNIDIKRNKGLVGIKITRRITVDDVAQDANHVESSSDLKNEESNKNNTTVNNDTETYVKAVDKLLERVGTFITPILEDKDVCVTSTVNNNNLEVKPPPDNNNKPKIKCQLTNIPPKILENVLKLKDAKLPKEGNEQISFNKSINNSKDNEDKCMTLFNKVIMGSKINNDQKTSEISSSLSQNKYEKKSCQDEIKFSHNIDRSKYRPMPKCKKLLENLRNKSSEVKENSIERRDDKTSKRKDREISGIISPILPCTSNTSKKKSMFKLISKPHIIEPKKNNISCSVFEIHKYNDCGDKKLLNHHNNPKIKMPQKNKKLKSSSGGNEKDINKEKTALKLINNEKNHMLNKEEAIRKECSMIAQKVIDSIVNHEISTPLQSKDTTVRKQNIQKMTRKIDSNKQIKFSQNACELQPNSKVKPITHNDLKSESKPSLSKDGKSKVNIVSVENVRDSDEFNNFGSNVKSVTAQQSDNNLLKCGVQKPESIVLQRPMRAKTPHQHNIVSENISNFNIHPGNNTPTNNIPVINNQASTIILRPQSKPFHNFNTSGQPIQSHTTCRSQYPKVIKYPTLDKLLSKQNYKEVQIKYHVQPNPYLLPPNQNGYQYHNFVRHPPPHYGVNLVPVRPVYSDNFSAPNPNPYWRYGCSSVIPPPPPPPPPPLRENCNPNILTDIQPNDNSSIIGRNVNGLVKKINIVTTTTPPLQPEHDTKEGIVKLEPTSPRCALDMTSNISGGVPKTLTNTIEKPASTKSEMLEELERSMLEKSPTKTDLKRPHFENIVASADPRLPTVHKIGPLSKKIKPDQTTLSTKQTVTVPTKGYSPPILPIPTYQNFLSQVNSTVQNYIGEKPKVILRNPVTPIRHASPMNVGQNSRKAIKRLNYDKGPSVQKPAKKISIADYKKRSSPDTNKVQRVNNIPKSVVKVQSAQSKNYNSKNFNTQG